MTVDASGRPPAGKLTPAMRASLQRYWAAGHSYQRFLLWVVVIFVGSVVLHAVVFVVDDRPWGGQASWRQPMAFSLAFALILPAVAWVMSFLPRRRRLGWAVAGTLGGAAIGTVVIIAIQAWREQPAFFPEDLRLDQSLWTGMQVGIGLIVVSIVVAAAWALTPLDAPTSFRWAIRAGLALVVGGLAMGGIMIAEGVVQDMENEQPGRVQSPVMFGEAGLVLVPHLLALHALSVMSVLAWLLSFTSLAERRRTGVVQIALVGYTALVAVLLTQGLAGRAPLDLSGLLAALFWVGAAPVIAAAVATMTALVRRATGVAGP